MKLPRSLFYASYPSARQIEAAVDELAEELAKDRYTLSEIADRMDVTGGTAAVLFCDLCHRYGERAAI